MIACFIMFVLAGSVATATVMAWLRIRANRQRGLIQTLAAIVGQNLPLSGGLRAAADAERGATRRMFQTAAVRLELGDSLATALRGAVPTISGRILGTIQAGEAGGTTPSVLRDLAHELERERPDLDAPRTPLAYLLGMGVAIPLVVAFLAVTVLPKFWEIFKDFNTALPPGTVRLFDWAGAVRNHPGLTALVGLMLFAVVLQWAIGRHFLVRVPDRFQPVAASLDWVLWYTPLLRRLSESRSLSRQAPILHAAIAAGHDLPAAARQAACADANWFSRRRLRRWADAIEQGTDFVEAARRERFPAAVLSALAAGRADRLESALAYLALYYRNLSFHWERVLLAMVTPCIVLALAVCVGYIVVALFIPLIALTDAVAESVY